MTEKLRSIKIYVEVDTNKSTYKKEFIDVNEMLIWLEMLDLGIQTQDKENLEDDKP